MTPYITAIHALQGKADRADITPVGLTWTEHDGTTYSRHMVEIRDGGTYVRGFVTRVEGKHD
jgi:hypothetical protein